MNTFIPIFEGLVLTVTTIAIWKYYSEKNKRKMEAIKNDIKMFKLLTRKEEITNRLDISKLKFTSLINKEDITSRLDKCNISTQKCYYTFYNNKYYSNCKQENIEQCDRTCSCQILNIVYYSGMRDDPEFMSKAVSKAGSALEFASDNIKNDKSIVIEAVNNDGNSLEFASDDIKNDKSIVLIAMNQDVHSFRYASDNIKKDQELFSTYIKEIHYLLDKCNISTNKCDFDFRNEYCEQEEEELCYRTCCCHILDIVNKFYIKDDLEFWDKVVSKAGSALEYAPNNIINNKSIVLKAVNHDGMSLEFASDNLKVDTEVVLTAFKNNYRSLEFASEFMVLFDDDFYITLMKININAYNYIPYWHKNTYEIVSILIKSNGMKLEIVDQYYKSNKDIVLMAVSQNGLALAYADKVLRDDRDVVLMAVSQNGLSLIYASKVLKADRDIVLIAVSENGLALEYADIVLKANYDIVFAAVQQNGMSLHYALIKINIKSNVEVIIVAAANVKNPYIYSNLSIYKLFCDIARSKLSMMTLVILSQSLSRNILNKLNNHGPHFANVFKRHIAEFIIPTGQHWEINCGLGFRINYDDDYWNQLYIALKHKQLYVEQPNIYRIKPKW
jgi:hypothetical protein